MRNPTSPRFFLAVTMVLAFGPGLVPPATQPANAADATIVFAAYQAIMTHHLERQVPVKLLGGALVGLRQALAKAGVTAHLPDITAADEASVRSEFQARFDRAVRLAQGKLASMQLQYAAAKAMAENLGDGRTVFFTPEEWQIWNGKGYAGIGIQTTYNVGRLWIFSAEPLFPGANAGLRRFDRVVTVDGQSVQGMTIDQFRGRLRGPEGSTVKLAVLRPGRSEPLAFSIVRQHVPHVAGVLYKKLPGGLGYIWFRAAWAGDAALFRRALVDLQREGIRGLLLDLRFNSTPGGYLNVLSVANTLLRAGVPVQTILSHATDLGRPVRSDACPVLIQGHPRDLSHAEDLAVFPSPCRDVTSGGTLLDSSTPLVLIINETTQGPNETLSGAIRAARRGTLLGVRTAGRTGTGFDVALPGATGISVKTTLVLAGDGQAVTNIGVQPDVVVELTGQDLDRGVDTQLQQAEQMLAR